MAKRLFLAHWKLEEAAELVRLLRTHGWQVDTEHEDGGRAVQRILQDPPHAVLKSLARLPAHGRETARALKSSSQGASVPLILLDGYGKKLDAVRLLFPDAIYTNSSVVGFI